MNNFDLNNNNIKPNFKIPENYFEDFEAKMIDIIANKDRKKVIRIWNKKLIWVSGIAAIIIISVTLLPYFSMQNNAVLEEDLIENYLAVQPSINSYEMANHLTDEDIVDLENDLALELNNDDVELYLNENVDNIDMYIDE